MKKPITLTATVAVIIVLADQASKWAATEYLVGIPGKVVAVIGGFFYLRLVRNPGAAFGIGNDYGQVFTVLSLATIAVLIIFYRRFFSRTLSSRVAGGLILGGAVGNLIDRILHGYVVDFLDFKFGTYHWPAFNLADSAICVGVGILILITLFSPPAPRLSGSARSADPGTGSKEGPGPDHGR